MEKNIAMKHVFCDGFGGPEVLKVKESPIPVMSEKIQIFKYFCRF